ncbi:ubiquitin-like protein [Legionella quateirensis]|uniref:Ubiquitin family n=1 Tax=Legionella quateirensis TaxID=45072 RepID=A0A378KX88_9GAMM|nr:ubiquitin-like protein [Legionella quateirensis]KTD46450.1 Ubiquitin family protein [Legionella quateirensis]STY18769.1 Ubiquitin family [Legionella quateirensis]
MHLFLKTLMGQSIGITIENSRTATCLDIKKLIQQKKGFDISEQTILIAGKTWDDNLTYTEFREQSPHLPYELNQNHPRLVITPIPEHLRSLVKMNYHDLKELSPKLAAKLSENSRTIRFKEEIHISTQTYWNDLSIHERVKILSAQEYTDLVTLISNQKNTPQFQINSGKY